MRDKDRALALRSFFNPLTDESFWGSEASQTGLTVSEDKEHVFVEAYLPGLTPEDIEVTFEKGMLWIRGEKKEEEENKKKKYYRKASSSFAYRVQVPHLIDEKKEPNAVYKDGVMKITFLKAKQPRAKKIPVKRK